MTVGELKRALEEVNDDLPVEVYGPGDASVGIWDLSAEVTGAAVVTEYDTDDEEGNPTVVSLCFQVVVVEQEGLHLITQPSRHSRAYI